MPESIRDLEISAAVVRRHFDIRSQAQWVPFWNLVTDLSAIPMS